MPSRSKKPGTALAGIRPITHSDHVEQLLGSFRDQIGADFEGYRNHIYRVLSYSLYFLGGDETHRKTIETALVYHDIGLWTDRELAYLEPSMTMAEKECHHDRDLIANIILYHHKITAFKGPQAEIVNAVRKADLIDATRGLIRKGMPRQHIRKVQGALPAAGFYKTLMRLGPELTGGNPLVMFAKFAKVYKI